jgi:hypothetical protein
VMVSTSCVVPLTIGVSTEVVTRVRSTESSITPR